MYAIIETGGKQLKVEEGQACGIQSISDCSSYLLGALC